jgi:uncharacterized protein (DUF302 family)
MMKSIVVGVAAFVAGIVLTGLVMYASAEKMMLMEDKSPYGFDEAVEKFTAATEEAGWKIPMVHDLQATMENFGKEVNRVMVFELCHPDHAYRILSQNDERIVSSLMPCRVAIYEKNDGSVYVSRMNSGLMGKMMSGVVPEVMGVAARESEAIVKKILN